MNIRHSLKDKAELINLIIIMYNFIYLHLYYSKHKK